MLDPSEWMPLAEGEVGVAHISDCHFGSANDEAVWQVVAPYLKEIRPALLLVTGDLVDRPDPQSYRRAKELLDGLGVPYRVCAGNHDRHFRGNRVDLRALLKGTLWLRALAALAAVGGALALYLTVSPWGLLLLLAAVVCFLPELAALRGRRYTAALFDQVFAGHLVQPDAPIPLTVGSGPAAWRIGLLGADSSHGADAFARGYVPESSFQNLSAATQLADWDLCIFLVHHHVLAVRRLEERRQGRRGDLFNLTCLVNSGRLLEAFVRANVDLVLHGHEHCPNWATYGSFESNGGPVRVIGAGSVTGNDSLAGCDADRVSFNVLILTPNRSGRLRWVTRDGGKWKGEDFALFDAAEVRRSWLRRQQPALLGAVNSEVHKHVEITREHDIQVRWVYTNWFPPINCTQTIYNSTGVPVPDFVVRFIKPDGYQVTVRGDGVARATNEDHAWVLSWTVPETHRGTPLTMELSYRWLGGGILTEEEMRALTGDGHPLGMLRNEGLEFATLWTPQAVAAAELIVVLPPEYAPHPNDVHVRVSEDGQEMGHERAELRGRLRFVAPGRYVLRVPFPRKNRDYQLVWRPVPSARLPADAAAAIFRTAAGEYGEKLLRAFRAALRGSPFACAWPRDSSPGLELAFQGAMPGSPFTGPVSLALYLKDQTNPSLTRQVAYLPPGSPGPPAPDRPPPEVSLEGGRSALAQAWWGVPTVIARPPGADDARRIGLLPGETALVCVPLRFGLGWTNPPPWGVVRIGIHGDVNAGDFSADKASSLWPWLSPAASSLLTLALAEGRIPHA